MRFYTGVTYEEPVYGSFPHTCLKNTSYGNGNEHHQWRIKWTKRTLSLCTYRAHFNVRNWVTGRFNTRYVLSVTLSIQPEWTGTKSKLPCQDRRHGVKWEHLKMSILMSCIKTVKRNVLSRSIDRRRHMAGKNICTPRRHDVLA